MKDSEKMKKDLLYVFNDSNNTFKDDQIIISMYIKKNYKKICYMDLKEFSSIVTISENIINDFLFQLGFSDYDGFRKDLRKFIMAELKTTERFQLTMNNLEPQVKSVLNSVVEKEMQNLSNLLLSFDEKMFTSIVEDLINSNEIIVVATRSSMPIAIYVEYIFNRIGKKTRKIISCGTENFDPLVLADRDTVILAIGFARYSNDTLKILSFFKRRNFKIISITDNPLSPLSRFSDKTLCIPCDSNSFTDFYAVPICIINIIVTLISQLNKDISLKYLNEFENIAKELGFYF